MEESWKSWIKPLLAVVLVGILLVGGIAWLLFSKAKHKPIAPEHLYSENGAIEAPAEKTAQNVNAPQSSSGSNASAQTAQVPVAAAAPQGAPGQPPPPPPGGDDRGGPPPPSSQRPDSGRLSASARPDSAAVSARASTDTQNREANMRASMKKRIESTTPEDRARMAQLRIEERKYRQSHGGSSGGRP